MLFYSKSAIAKVHLNMDTEENENNINLEIGGRSSNQLILYNLISFKLIINLVSVNMYIRLNSDSTYKLK